MRSWSPVCVLGGTREYLGCRRSRSERNPAGPCCFDAPLANCTWAVGSCALRTVPPSVVGCDLYSQWKTVCSAKEDFGLNITSKEMHLALFPPPVASLQTGKLLSFCACCLTPSSLLFSTFGWILHLSSGLFCSQVFARVAVSITGVGTEMLSRSPLSGQQQHVKQPNGGQSFQFSLQML